MEMRVNFIIRTLYSKRKRPHSALNRRHPGPENGLGHFDKKKIFCPCWESKLFSFIPQHTKYEVLKLWSAIIIIIIINYKITLMQQSSHEAFIFHHYQYLHKGLSTCSNLDREILTTWCAYPVILPNDRWGPYLFLRHVCPNLFQQISNTALRIFFLYMAFVFRL